MSTYKLSPAQLAAFKSDGFVVVRADEHQLVDPAALQEWVSEVRSWPRESGKWMPYYEINNQGEKHIMRTECFIDYHEGLKQVLCGDATLSIMSQLGGHSMLLLKDKINYKGPNGQGFPAHTEYAGYNHMSKSEHITANFCIDAADVRNGCLEVVPGSHKLDIAFEAQTRIRSDWEASHTWLPVPLSPGDILFFGSHLAHRSGPNCTDTSRAMVYATYHTTADGTDLREKYYAHRRLVFPPDHERKIGADYEEGYKRYTYAGPYAREAAVEPVAGTA